MSEPESESLPAAPEAPVRKRPKPGERRVQILQALATMLEQPGAERITTAALAARLDVSEAALYRHFASKAQMFEALIDFIESAIFSLTNQLQEREPDAMTRVIKTARILVQFAEKNPGMTRVMVGDALVFEHERLQERMNLFFDKLEAQWRQLLREAGAASQTPTVDAQLRASLLQAFLLGRLQRYARSGFRRLPSESLDASLAIVLASPA
jgi:TetR/AcrR family transcriptional regulator